MEMKDKTRETEQPETIIAVENVMKRYGTQTVLKDV